MEAIGAFLGALVGSIAAKYLKKNKESITLEPGTGTMKNHVYVDVVKKQTVFRDKEIEAEENANNPRTARNT